eukprot:1374285-Prymnesium_polylepis.1
MQSAMRMAPRGSSMQLASALPHSTTTTAACVSVACFSCSVRLSRRSVRNPCAASAVPSAAALTSTRPLPGPACATARKLKSSRPALSSSRSEPPAPVPTGSVSSCAAAAATAPP